MTDAAVEELRRRLVAAQQASWGGQRPLLNRDPSGLIYIPDDASTQPDTLMDSNTLPAAQASAPPPTPAASAATAAKPVEETAAAAVAIQWLKDLFHAQSQQLQDQKEDMMAMQTELEQKLATMRVDAQESLAAWRMKEAELKHTIASKEAENGALRKDVTSSRAELDTVQQTLVVEVAERKRLRGQFEATESLLKRQERRIAELDAKLVAATEEVEVLRNAQAEATAEVHRFQSSISEIEAKAKADVAAAVQAQNGAVVECETWRSKVHALTSELQHAKEAAIRQAAAAEQAQEAARIQHQAQIDELEARLARNTSAANADTARQVEALNASLTEARERIAVLTKEAANDKALKSSLESRLKSQAADLAAIRQESQHSAQQQANLGVALSAYETTVQELRTTADARLKELQAARQDQEKTADELQAALKRIEALQAELQTAAEARQSLAAEMSAQRSIGSGASLFGTSATKRRRSDGSSLNTSAADITELTDLVLSKVGGVGQVELPPVHMEMVFGRGTRCCIEDVRISRKAVTLCRTGATTCTARREGQSFVFFRVNSDAEWQAMEVGQVVELSLGHQLSFLAGDEALKECFSLVPKGWELPQVYAMLGPAAPATVPPSAPAPIPTTQALPKSSIFADMFEDD